MGEEARGRGQGEGPGGGARGRGYGGQGEEEHDKEADVLTRVGAISSHLRPMLRGSIPDGRWAQGVRQLGGIGGGAVG
jgi:hypothetical protein